MPSMQWRVLGQGDVLGSLRADLKDARGEVILVGPWIDEYFAEQVIQACSRPVSFRIITRPDESLSPGFLEHAQAARRAFLDTGRCRVKTVRDLHAKTITIDESIAYCGSANWYRYSLEESREITLRGPLSQIPGLLDEVELLWQSGGGEPTGPSPSMSKARPKSAGQGYREELLDPIAAAVLAKTPGAFVLGRKKRR